MVAGAKFVRPACTSQEGRMEGWKGESRIGGCERELVVQWYVWYGFFNSCVLIIIDNGVWWEHPSGSRIYDYILDNYEPMVDSRGAADESQSG